MHTLHLCQSLLTRNPETEAGVNLLQLVSMLNDVKTQSDKTVWTAWLKRFEERYGDFIKQLSRGLTMRIDGTGGLPIET